MINYRKLKKKSKIRTGLWESPSGISLPIIIRPHNEKLELILKNSKSINRNKKVQLIKGNEALANVKLRPMVEKRIAEIGNPMDAVFKYYDTTEDKELETIANYESTLLECIINIDMDATLKKSEILDELELEKSEIESNGTVIEEDGENLKQLLELFQTKEEITLWEFFGVKIGDYYELLKFLTTRPDDEDGDCIIRDYEDVFDLSCYIEAVKTGRTKLDIMTEKMSFVGNMNKIAELANEKLPDGKQKDDITEKVKKVAKNGGRKKS